MFDEMFLPSDHKKQIFYNFLFLIYFSTFKFPCLWRQRQIKITIFKGKNKVVQKEKSQKIMTNSVNFPGTFYQAQTSYFFFITFFVEYIPESNKFFTSKYSIMLCQQSQYDQLFFSVNIEEHNFFVEYIPESTKFFTSKYSIILCQQSQYD